MLQDTVLVGGFAFLVSGALVWILLNKVNGSNWPIRSKRLATYALLAFLVAVAIFVIDWHSSNYKKNYQADSSGIHQMILKNESHV